MKNERKNYKDYVGLVLCTMPESIMNVDNKETFMISELFTIAGRKEFTIVYGKVMNDTFYYCHNDDGNLFKYCNCDALIQLIEEGKIFKVQNFVHRKFIDMKLSQTEIRKVMGRVTLIHTMAQ